MSGQLDTSLPEGFLHERLLETRNSPPCYAPPVPSIGSLIDFYKEPLHELCTSFYWKPPPAEAKKKSSSLKSSKSNTNGEKKIVRFADVMGLDLADVHTFLDEIPRIPKSAFKDLKDKDAPALTKPQVSSPALQRKFYNSRADRNLVPLFVQPTSRPDFIDRLTRQKVCLENAFVTNTNCLNIRGTVRVVNLDFHKKVTARLSKDRWHTNQNAPCSYLESCPDGGFSDRFTFIIPGDDVAPGSRLEIALKYEVSGAEYWDNNNGQNYCFHAVQENRHSSDGTLTHSSSAAALENWGSSSHTWAY